MNDIYSARMMHAGVNYGGVQLQGSGKIGGQRSVFVKWQGQGKDSLTFPSIGGIVKNPFKGFAKAYAGDLCEFDPVACELKLLKTYEVSAAAADNAKTIKLVRDGYHHIPFVGDILMVAPEAIDGTAKAVVVTAVKEEGGDVWSVTLSDNLGVAVAVGDVLVEGAESGAEVKSMVTNPNTYLASDVDFVFTPGTPGAEDMDGAQYTLTPCIANGSTKLYISKMSKLPKSVLALNKSRFNGWFEL